MLGDLSRSQAVGLLRKLNLPKDDFVIAGSGVLMAHGYVEGIADVDVVARGDAWHQALEMGNPEPAPYSNVQRIRLFGERVEVLNGWFPEIWDLDALIDGADTICNIHFMQPKVVVDTMRMLDRPRDRKHLVAIKEHLEMES